MQDAALRPTADKDWLSWFTSDRDLDEAKVQAAFKDYTQSTATGTATGAAGATTATTSTTANAADATAPGVQSESMDLADSGESSAGETTDTSPAAKLKAQLRAEREAQNHFSSKLMGVLLDSRK